MDDDREDNKEADCSSSSRVATRSITCLKGGVTGVFCDQLLVTVDGLVVVAFFYEERRQKPSMQSWSPTVLLCSFAL
jgi:hypothetical protein